MLKTPAENLDRPETREVVEGDHLSCYAKVPKKEGGIFDILIRFTLKKAWTF